MALVTIFSIHCLSAATVITFEGLTPSSTNPPGITNDYSSLGILFAGGPDGVVRDGVTGWGITGTNGSQFLGYNGEPPGTGPFGEILLFAEDIAAISFDASRSSGSSSGQSLIISGYLDGGFVESSSVVLGNIGDWSTASLVGQFDEVRFESTGSSTFRPFGIDNLSFTSVPEPSSAFLLGLGALALLARRRYR